MHILSIHAAVYTHVVLCSSLLLWFVATALKHVEPCVQRALNKRIVLAKVKASLTDPFAPDIASAKMRFDLTTGKALSQVGLPNA